MGWPQVLIRPHPGLLVVLGASTVGGFGFRYAATDGPDSHLNPHTFTSFTLVEKQPVSSRGSLFVLRNRDGSPDQHALKDVWKKAVWSVQVKQPQLQIARAYTPLPPKQDTSQKGYEHDHDDAHELRLFIRREDGGEVSTYLHSLPQQSTVELRGPNVEAEIPDDVEEVLFLAGGTGIAPALQVAHSLLDKPAARMRILWANRKQEECMGGQNDSLQPQAAPGRLSGWRSLFGLEEPIITQDYAVTGGKKGPIVQELEALKDYANARSGHPIDVEYFVDEEKKFIKPVDVTKYLNVAERRPSHIYKGTKMIMVSGPDGFIDYWAGKKLWVGGREVQGPLGGILSQLDIKDWKVLKL